MYTVSENGSIPTFLINMPKKSTKVKKSFQLITGVSDETNETLSLYYPEI